MSYARKNAIITAAIWAVVLIGLLLSVLLPGPERFAVPEYAPWRLISAIVILPGFLVNAWLGWRTKRGKERGEIDERDEAIARRASQITLMAIGMVVFLAGILLYDLYRDTGGVPAGWLWLLAYGTVALLSLVHALAGLLLDLRGDPDA
ncbi:MAG: hypothetical protein RRA94_06540 [Bacteroidota bacterium]|nr:hypothetical protein [Bacteroidota bacterium]